jgi:MFS transporter, SP family, solute carrier family 2 (myo-inositol transporter), member 13
MGSVVSVCLIDHMVRRKLLVLSLVDIILSLGVLTVVFHDTMTHWLSISVVATDCFDARSCIVRTRDLTFG